MVLEWLEYTAYYTLYISISLSPSFLLSLSLPPLAPGNWPHSSADQTISSSISGKLTMPQSKPTPHQLTHTHIITSELLYNIDVYYETSFMCTYVM